MASLLFSLWNLQHIKRKTKESSQAVMMFEAQQIRRNADDHLHAEIWSPPEQFFCVTGNDDGMLWLWKSCAGKKVASYPGHLVNCHVILTCIHAGLYTQLQRLLILQHIMFCEIVTRYLEWWMESTTILFCCCWRNYGSRPEESITSKSVAPIQAPGQAWAKTQTWWCHHRGGETGSRMV